MQAAAIIEPIRRTAVDIAFEMEPTVLAAKHLVRALIAVNEDPDTTRETSAFLIYQLLERVETLEAHWQSLVNKTAH